MNQSDPQILTSRNDYVPTDPLLSHRCQISVFKTVDAAKRRDRCIIGGRGANWHPGINSKTEIDSRFRFELVELLNKEVPRTVLDDGTVGDNGVHTDWGLLLSKPGFDQTPLSLPGLDNDQRRKDLGLTTGTPSDHDRELFITILRHLLSEWDLVSFRATNGSSDGLPTCSTSGVGKRKTAEYLLSDSNEVAKLVAKRDFTSLYHRYDMLWMYLLQIRRQTDSVGKQRKVLTLDNWRTGIMTDAVNQFYDETGVCDPRFTCMRGRTVYAAPWRVNLFTQAVASGYMASIFRRFSTCFKHTTPADTADKINSCVSSVANLLQDTGTPATEQVEVFFADISQYDTTIPAWMFDCICDVLEENWHQSIVDMIRWLLHASFYAADHSYDPATGKSIASRVFVGDPMQADKSPLNYGLPSGIGFVSLIGKVCRFAEGLIVVNAVTNDVAANIADYCSGKGIYVQLNAGDDTVEIMPKWLAIAMEEQREAGRGFFKIAPEEGKGFIGSLYKQRSDGLWFGISRITTMLAKRVSPEHGVDHFFRQGWSIGEYERANFYGDNPSYTAVSDVFNHCYDKHLRAQFGDYHTNVELAYRDYRNRAGSVPVSWIDAAILDDPSKLFYRYDDSQVSSAVLDQVSTRISLSCVRDFAARHCNVNHVNEV